MRPQQQLSASQESTKMNPEFSDSGLLRATSALRFIQAQLADLTMDCDDTLKNGLVSFQYVVKLQNNLEKLLHETRSLCSPPLRKPTESDFETINRVSGGSFGSVNLVRHKISSQVFAMKVIKWHNLTTRSQIRQVIEERDILTFMESPYVVSLFCSFDTQNDVRMIMEYVAGGDCASLLSEMKRFPVQMAKLYAAETAMALEHIHGYGILHRDLKPSNLLISSTGHIKMTDFGLAKMGPVQMTGENQSEPIAHIVREFTDRETAGTPVYMAPETILRQGYGKPVDWWALGIILYEFLVGEPPFDGKTFNDLFSRVVNDDVSWPEGEKAPPADAQDLIELLLEKNAIIRLGTGGAVEVKMHPFFDDLDPKQQPPYVPTLKNEEDTSHFDSRSDLCADDDEDSPVLLPDFCSVAFRFREVYSYPMHVSMATLNQDLQSGLNQGEESSSEEEEEYDHRFYEEESPEEEQELSIGEVQFEEFQEVYWGKIKLKEPEEEFDEGFEEEENDSFDEFAKKEEDPENIDKKEQEEERINEEEEQQQFAQATLRRRKRRRGRGRRKSRRGKKRGRGKGSGKKRRWCKRRRRRRRERRKKNRSCSRRRRRRGVKRRR